MAAFPFGAGTEPEGLLAELDANRKTVNFFVPVSEQQQGIPPKILCRIPLAQYLDSRESVAREVEMHPELLAGEQPRFPNDLGGPRAEPEKTPSPVHPS